MERFETGSINKYFVTPTLVLMGKSPPALPDNAYSIGPVDSAIPF
jgi:hypothetical protein